MRDARGGTRWLQGRATPWRAKSAVQNYYNSTTFSYFGPSEPTLDLRLLQPPDLHHFLGNCPGRSQKFVAPHSEHAYFGTSITSYTVTTILPICAFDSMYRCASTIWSSVNVRAMIGFNFPFSRSS